MLNMNRMLIIGVAMAALALAGCGNQGEESSETDAEGSAEQTSQMTDTEHEHAGENGDHDDHAHDELAHEHHDPDHAHEDHEHGPGVRSLGTIAIAGTELEIRSGRAAEPGADLNIDIVHAGGPMPAAVRLWIGGESGVGSLKTKADSHGDHYHGQSSAPETMDASTALWIEVETAEGERVAESVALE